MSETGDPAPAHPGKGAGAFRTIGEVAEDLDLPTHVLRFWESKFPQLRPLKRGGGRRYYRPEDIVLLRRIRQCLYQEGYTIRGVQQLLGAAGGKLAPVGDPAAPAGLFAFDPAPAPAAKQPRRSRQPASPDTRQALEEIRHELVEARTLLDALLRRPKPP